MKLRKKDLIALATTHAGKVKLLRGAERIWPPSAARRSVAVPNGEGVASGSATPQ